MSSLRFVGRGSPSREFRPCGIDFVPKLRTIEHVRWTAYPRTEPRQGPRTMSRQDANAALARTSFLWGGNAPYIEDLQARYEADPGSVDAEWQAFFRGL